MTAPLQTRGRVDFAVRLREHSDRPALLTASETVTYRELADRVERAGAQLGTLRRLVLIVAAPEIDLLVTYLACLAGGHPVLLTSPAAAADLIDRYDPDVVAGNGTFVERREGSTHTLHPDLALLLSSSGSTGSPKLVRLSHGNLQANADAIADSLGIRMTDRAITSLPLHYCYGLSVLHSHLARGAATVLTPLSVTEACFWELFRSTRATTLAGVPHTFALLDRVGFADLDLPHLRYLTQAGGRLAPEAVCRYAELGQRRGWDLVVMYGQTEATARMAYLPPNLASSHPTAIGRAVPGGQLDLDDGELVYRGPNVMLGYAETAGDLALGGTITTLRTGDLARRTPEGLIEVIGRRSRFSKVCGLRLDLDLLEERLQADDRAIAIVCDDHALVVVAEGSTVGLRSAAAAAAGLPESAVQIVPCPSLPRTASGKLDRPALELLRRPAPTARADTVRAVLAEALARPDATDQDSFSSLGGDSLSYVEASLRIEELIGYLPAGWHLQPAADLDALHRAPRRGRSVDTTIVLRALAIVLVVAHHSHLFRVLGGAHLLLGVAGFNYARFLLTPAPRRERLTRLLRSTARIVVPTVIAVGVTTLVLGRYDWRHLLLVHDLLAPGQMFQHFWFVEVLVQTLLATGLLLGVPALDRLERRGPFAVPCGLLAVGLLLRVDVLPALSGQPRLYAPYALFWLFAWGWAAARARTATHRLLLTAVLLAAMPGFFLGSSARELVVGAALGLLLWVRSVRVPDAVARVTGVLAAASLYVYVGHFLVVKGFSEPLVAVAASFAVGLAYWQLAVRSGRRWATRAARTQPLRAKASFQTGS